MSEKTIKTLTAHGVTVRIHLFGSVPVVTVEAPQDEDGDEVVRVFLGKDDEPIYENPTLSEQEDAEDEDDEEDDAEEITEDELEALLAVEDAARKLANGQAVSASPTQLTIGKSKVVFLKEKLDELDKVRAEEGEG